MKLKTIITFLLAGTLALSCADKKPGPDPEYVAAVSGGIVGRTESIKVVFAHSQDSSTLPPASAFVLSPTAKGAVSWQDEYTLIFTPSEALKPGQRYHAQITLGNIPPFTFEFMTSTPYLSVNLEPVQVDEFGDVFIRGIVNVDEDALLSQIEGIITSPELGKALWEHENGMHRFSFNPAKRLEASRTVSINWDGRTIGSSEKGFTIVEIPGLNTFKVLGLSADNGVITVSFSSPLKQYSDLRGFISLSGKTDIRYSLEGNILRIFGDNTGGILPGTELVIQDLEDVNGNFLIVPVQYTVPDKWELPEVRIAGNGTILPTSQGAQLVVETRNISGLLIEAFHIYEDNMLQFLQINNMDGTYELERVGEPVWTRAVDFPWADTDQNRWISRGIDVSELSRKFPGGMFHIRVTFRQRHVHYECDAGHGDFSQLTFADDSFPSYGIYEPSYWNNYYYTSGFDWSEWYRYSNDPCHPAFYVPSFNYNIIVSRNVMVSNLGLIAKKSLDNSWMLATTNLITARPSPNTEYRVYNYQGRLLFQGRTGTDGMAFIPPFTEGSSTSLRLIVYAENSLGRAYLKINDSASLAISHFDVSGSSPSQGIKGLIYGERGVWRPGDDIFLTFLLSDPQAALPANHPVTLEFEDPRGRLVTTRTYTSSVDGFYPIAVSTSPDAPTGDWIARVRVGGNVFSRTIKVETVMPNRLKMDLDFGGDTIRSGRRQVSLEAEWLYGAVAPGLKADISVTFADRETRFADYADYSFRDASRTVSSERQTVWEGNLDTAGKALFDMQLNPGNAVPGKVTARFMTRVFEPSGVFSSEQISMEYSPYSRYAGLRLPRGDATRNMLLTDTDHRADIVILDEDGKLVTGNVTVNCAMYKLDWRWWWEMGATESAEFTSTLARNALSRETITVVNGRASWNFRVNYPDWGRYLIVVQDNVGGHAASQVVYIDWPGWAGRSLESGQGSQSMLTLNPEKTSYNTGERVSISFPSNKDATALAIVEKGGEIVRSEWITCNEGITKFEFSAEPSMVPNVYVHVTMLQPHLQAQNDLPIRLYGIVPVTVQDTRVVLHPRISVSENWEAESRVSFTVSEANSRPMAYTVAVVDEGLLGLTRYSLPNPVNNFYAREASFLKSWDLFQDVIGSYSGRLETLLAIGGGDDEFMDTSKETQRFKPVVRFFGPFEIKAGEQKTESFELPPYTGALRVMVMAASSSNEVRISNTQRAYGTAEESVKVTSDLMVFASLPRVLSPGDEVEVPVYVNSYKEGNRSVRVSLNVPGAVVQGSSTQNVSFDKSGEQLIRFRVKAPANPGQLQFIATAESAGLKTARHVTDMEVRSTAIPVTRSAYSLISPGETWTGNLEYPGRIGSNSLIMGFSRLPPLNLETRLEFLLTYPHGCVEQTTSAVFPQLYLDKILNLDNIRLAEIRSNVNAGIERLSGMQLRSGGFVYWPGDSTAHDWGSSYVGHFLLEARKAGYTVLDSVITSWIAYQKNAAAQWQARNGKFVEQAYRLYTLALAGEADLGSMNRLREQRDLPLQVTWRLAAAYWYAGQRDIARNMVRGLSLPQGEYRELSGTFGSSLRDKAMILETMILLGTGQGASSDELGRTRSLVEEISTALSSDRWLSTQETAYALIAMAPYMQQNAGSGSLSLDYSTASRSGNITFNSPSTEESLGIVTGTSGSYSITNRSSVPVYVHLTARGLPEEGSEPTLSEGLSLIVQYRDSSGRIIDPNSLRAGEDMEVRVSVRNSYGQAVEEIALVVPVPASWEIINTRLGDATALSSFSYQDIRDDRVMTYFNLNRNEEKIISFMVNKTYEGSFFRPAIHAYAMYDESIRALIPGVR